MNVRRSFPAEPGSVTKARHFVLSELSGLPEEQLGIIALMVSELATNAVVHAETAFSVEVKWNRGEVRVDVTDAAPGEPEMGSPEPTDPHGRGLRIVDELSDSWGVVASSTGREGKSVWFKVALSASPSGSRRRQETRRVHADNGGRT